mmetsp:Transcript_43830/g.115915  ORF Transcript_43830/g.115915 Transcript_43830/m.115915 type:complete len:206 (-) Transcript_43830:446-1063(-)
MAPLPGNEPPALARAKVLNDTQWLIYCCCGGQGIGPVGDPLCASEVKQLCIRGSSSTTDISGEDGLCNQVEVCLCITQQCQFPPVEDAPVCACCNKKCGGSKGSTKWKADLFDKSKIMDDTFWMYYFLCSGCGINKMDQGLFSAQFKELCCRGYSNIEAPSIDGVFCSGVQTSLCFWSEFQIPPAKPNPFIAICTWRSNKEPFTG